MNEFIGIRYGKVSDTTEWIYRPHSKFDGIGGLADIFRECGEKIEKLPEITHLGKTSHINTLKTGLKSSLPRKRVTWSDEFIANANANPTAIAASQAPDCVAWHIFSNIETQEIIRFARTTDVTVNSVLVRLLDKAIRPDLSCKSDELPWMIPVNLRGIISQTSDTGNHSSAVMITTHPSHRFHETHDAIYAKLKQGEHWSMWHNYNLTRKLPHKVKAALIEKDMAMPQWNIGSFSNLGVWDRDNLFDESSDFLFMPPVLRCQWLGAGCVTYKGKLSIAIQAHPEVSTNPDIAKKWVHRWVQEILDCIPKISIG